GKDTNGMNLLVREGLAVMVGGELLDNEELKDALGGMITDMLDIEVSVNELKPANNKNLGKEGVIKLGLKALGFLPVTGDLIITDTKETKDGEIERGIFIDIEDANPLGALVKLLAFPMDMSMPIELDMVELISGFLGGGGDETLVKYIFPNLYGLPEEMPDPDPDTSLGEVAYTAIGGGLYVADGADVDIDPSGNAIFPDVSLFELPESLDLDKIRPDETYNMGLAFSQYNLSQVLGALVDGLEIPISNPLILAEIPIAIPDLSNTSPGTSQKLVISLNPNGIVLDLRASVPRLMANDVCIQYIQGADAMWEMSLDISLILDIGLTIKDVEGVAHIFLDLNLEPQSEYIHTHVMWDNMGIGWFDHSDFADILVTALPDMLGDGTGGPLYSVDLSGLGMMPKGSDPGIIDYGDGSCFLKLALESFDVAGLLGDEGLTCFINTATAF
ncbi:MAG: hypothetical protein U9P49_10895, partial [Thermodesulfobacteriota bacterium]|nr:hypothetical protein [Thermodesulfobacteriota bacterium]